MIKKKRVLSQTLFTQGFKVCYDIIYELVSNVTSSGVKDITSGMFVTNLSLKN